MERIVRTTRGLVALGWATVPDTNEIYVDRAAIWTTPAAALPPAIPAVAVPSIGGHWTSLPPLTTPRWQPAAAAGLDGRIYVFGGTTRLGGMKQNTQLASVEVFDPTTGSWMPGAPIPGSLAYREAAITARDGRIFLFHQMSARVLVFDSVRGTWSAAPSIPSGRGAAFASLGPDGRIIVGTPTSPVRLYQLDPATMRWTRGGTMDALVAPSLWAADGRAYGVAGIRAWSIEPSTGKSRALAAMPPATTQTWGTAALRGLLWALGTEHREPSTIEAWATPVLLAYDPSTNHWNQGPPPPAGVSLGTVAGATAVALGDRLYLVGSSSTSTTNSAWVVAPDLPLLR